MEELNLGPPNTNPSSGREEDWNSGPPDYKSSALTTRPRCRLLINAASKARCPMVIAPDPGSSGLGAPFSKVSEVPVPNFLVVLLPCLLSRPRY